MPLSKQQVLRGAALPCLWECAKACLVTEFRRPRELHFTVALAELVCIIWSSHLPIVVRALLEDLKHENISLVRPTNPSATLLLSNQSSCK